MANGRPPGAGKPRAQVFKRARSRVDVVVDHNTISDGKKITERISNEIGEAQPNKTVTLAGKQLIMNQAAACLLAKEAREAGYAVRLRIPGAQNKDNLQAPLLEMIDAIEEE